MFVYTCRVKSDKKTSEDLESEKIKKLKQDAQKQKQLSKESFKRIKSRKSSTPAAPIKAVHPPTEPIEYQFKTESRLRTRSRTEKGKLGDVSMMDSSRFQNSLRSYGTPPFNPNDPSEVNDIYIICTHDAV